jgi:transposase
MLPDSFPPPSTVYRWFARFRDNGTWETINRKRPANAFAGAATRFRVGVLTHLPGCARLSPDRIVLS